MEQGPTKTDREDLDSAIDDRGVIPKFTTYNKSAPYNPGQFFQNHLDRLPKDATRLFCMPKMLGTKLHDPSTTSLYTLEPCGKNTIDKMVSKLSAAMGVGHFTNHDLRSTSIVAMRRSQALKLHDIRKITGHKNDKTIEECYIPGMSSSKRADAALAILHSSRFSRGETFQPVSSHMKVKDPGNSQYYTPVSELFVPVVQPDADFDLGTEFDAYIQPPPDDSLSSSKRKSQDTKREATKRVANVTSTLDIETFLRSNNTGKVALTGFDKNQSDLVHFPLSYVDQDPDLDSTTVLFSRCTDDVDKDDTIIVTLTDGNIPVPTLKTLKAKSKRRKILNATFLLDWKMSGTMPDQEAEKYQVACSSVHNLFTGITFFMYECHECSYAVKDIIAFIGDCGGRLVDGSLVDLHENVIILGDRQLPVKNQVLCPSFIPACIISGQLVEKIPYVYPSKLPPTISPIVKMKLCVKPVDVQPPPQVTPAQLPPATILPPARQAISGPFNSGVAGSADQQYPGLGHPSINYPGMLGPGMSHPGMQHPAQMFHSGVQLPGMPLPGMPLPGMHGHGMPLPGMPLPGMPFPGMPGPYHGMSHIGSYGGTQLPGLSVDRRTGIKIIYGALFEKSHYALFFYIYG